MIRLSSEYNVEKRTAFVKGYVVKILGSIFPFRNVKRSKFKILLFYRSQNSFVLTLFSSIHAVSYTFQYTFQ